MILVIEDDRAISELYEAVLTDAGYQVKLMASKPLDVQVIAQIKPELVISDWGVSQDNLNWNFINEMQEAPGTAAIPILVCTTISLKTCNIGNLLTERKITWLEKPFDIVELLDLIEKTTCTLAAN
jgi:DNA-binding response OmpR family regulator